MRRSLLLAMLVLAGFAAPAHAALGDPACGSATASALEAEDSSPNFQVYGGAVVTPPTAQFTAIKDAFQGTYDRLVAQFGWAAPPLDPDTNGKYLLRLAGSATGLQSTGSGADASVPDNPNTAWDDQDADVTCIVVPDDFDTAEELQPFAAREFARAIWHGMGAHTGDGAAPAWLLAGGAELMEDEVFTSDAPDELSPDWDQPLAGYPDSPTAWLILRGVTEPFGTGLTGGAEDVVQVAFDAHSKGTPPGLDGLAAGVAPKGATIADAYHHYAVAARFLTPCPESRAFPCFADAAAYGEAPGSHASVDSTGTALQDSVPAGLAPRWIDLPAGRYDVKLTGAVTASAVCDSGDSLRVTALAPGARVRDIACADGVRPVLVASSGPATGAAVPYTLEFLPATVVLTVTRFGEGLVGSTDELIDCGATCSATYEIGSKVTLGAQPKPGHTFAGWAGPCTGTTVVCEVTMSDHVTLAAGFSPLKTGAPSGPGGPTSDDTTAPKVLFAKPRITRNRRKIKAELTCPAEEVSSCTGPVGIVLRVGRKRFPFDGKAIVGVKPGISRVVKYELSSSARNRLRPGRRVSVKVSIRARDEAFNSVSLSRTFKRVKVPRRR